MSEHQDLQKEVRSWFVTLVSSLTRASVALSDEELLLIEGERELFFKETGVSESIMEGWLKRFFFLELAIGFSSTDEQRQLSKENLESFFEEVEDYKKSLDLLNLETQNSIFPAA